MKHIVTLAPILYDDGIKQLTTSIIDAVRTTRKYGIGYMFITQTIESLHREIREQIRIFALAMASPVALNSQK